MRLGVRRTGSSHHQQLPLSQTPFCIPTIGLKCVYWHARHLKTSCTKLVTFSSAIPILHGWCPISKCGICRLYCAGLQPCASKTPHHVCDAAIQTEHVLTSMHQAAPVHCGYCGMRHTLHDTSIALQLNTAAPPSPKRLQWRCTPPCAEHASQYTPTHCQTYIPASELEL
jgi:hypothetical protein